MKIKKQLYLCLYLVPIFGYFQIIKENFFIIKTNKTIIYYEKFRSTGGRGLAAA